MAAGTRLAWKARSCQSQGTSSVQSDLFGFDDAGPASGAWPEGFVYRTNFIEVDEEAALLDVIARLPLAAARYKSYIARRRIVSFGGEYDYDTNLLRPGSPLPAELLPLRERAASWLGVPPDSLSHALVSQYQPQTPLGWHRDVPDFESIVGISLGGTARLRFRPYPPVQPRKADVLNLDLAPRSAYLMRGPARWDWQHSIAPTEMLRYSITFRTRRLRA
jgi:alkylated DNA repair dioxygenase AlkB